MSDLQHLGGIELVESLMDLLAVNADLGRSRDTDPHLFSLDSRNGHANASIDNDFFADSTRKNKHFLLREVGESLEVAP
jgi:hypothetical protein